MNMHVNGNTLKVLHWYADGEKKEINLISRWVDCATSMNCSAENLQYTLYILYKKIKNTVCVCATYLNRQNCALVMFDFPASVSHHHVFIGFDLDSIPSRCCAISRQAKIRAEIMSCEQDINHPSNPKLSLEAMQVYQLCYDVFIDCG